MIREEVYQMRVLRRTPALGWRRLERGQQLGFFLEKVHGAAFFFEDIGFRGRGRASNESFTEFPARDAR